MYDYGYGYSYYYDSPSSFSIFSGAFIVVWIIALAISAFNIVCLWKVFVKAGKPGWAAIVPVYNIIVLLEIVELPMWYIALCFVPFANIYALIMIYINLAHKFGKSTGFGIGLAFLSVVFLALLAFDKNSVYVGASSNVNQSQQPINNYSNQQPTNNYSNQQPINNYSNQQPTNNYSYQQPTNNYSYQQPQQPVNNVNMQSSQSSFCPNCGASVISNTGFCSNCGTKINNN